MLPKIYQTILTNFCTTVYTGESLDLATFAAKDSGFECTILLDGTLIKTYSPISGWKFIFKT
jgi:hypothetical protein